jgi:hypothetical protein
MRRQNGWNPFAGGVKSLVETAMAAPAMLVEHLCRRAYRWYLTRRSSTWDSPEQVRLEPDCLKLHTKSHRQSVLSRFDNALHNLDG